MVRSATALFDSHPHPQLFCRFAEHIGTGRKGNLSLRGTRLAPVATAAEQLLFFKNE